MWDQVEQVLLRYGIRPLLAVVPENKDPHLQVAPPRPHFWNSVRRWQALGWTIGLHGYEHRYVTRESGLLGINSYSEFAGLSEAEQRTRLIAGLSIFDREGIRPDIWVAPGHSFDGATIRSLLQLGIQTVSDGFSLFPYTDAQGMLWIPQQLWRFRRAPLGVWTICLHPNSWSVTNLRVFAEWIERYHTSIITFSEVVENYRGRPLSTLDRCFRSACKTKLRLRHAAHTLSYSIAMSHKLFLIILP